MTLLSETQIGLETEDDATIETAPAEESAVTISFRDHYYSLMNNVIWSSPFSREEWLPYSPVDIDQRVYVRLGDRTYTGGEHEQSVASFIGELQALAAKAPKRATAIIKLGTGYGCDDESCRDPEWEVGYWRNPTKKERAEREETNRKIAERDTRRAEEAATKERAEYERLRAKFEGAAK
jgi:hypothetical protein